MSPAKFKEIRERLGLTQTELSEVFGLSGFKPISHFETGFRTPSPLIAGLMSAFDSLSERKSTELIELLREHVQKIQKAKKRKSNARE